MSFTKKYLLIGAIALVIISVSGFFLFQSQNNSTNQNTNSQNNSNVSNDQASSTNQTTTELKNISKTELAAANGLNGNKCYVAIDGTVYDMSAYNLWQNGVHTISQGRAKCGQDLSQVIDSAPHGRSKLSIMPKVGKLV
ncbi:MAG: hypothetical protein OHK0017_00040 [Patescibacteria group bacterium]